MCASYRSKSRNTDFEQHANKIYTAIREIDPEYAEKRAIWELFQNALDIVDNKGIIKVLKTDKGFKFQHNGRPFNDGNLTGLIKQSSNGKTYGSNKNETGQYGTGFLSTHVYGKEILINASVHTDSDKIKLLYDFKIDRNSNSPDDLNKKIQIQDELAERICDKEGNELNEHIPFTSFEYIESDESKKYISNMFDYIPEILPFIFAFNDKLYSVEIQNNCTKTLFQRNSIKEAQLNLLINNTPLSFSFLSDTDKNIKIILPQNDFNFKNTPKLFLFYPLMETTEIGLNFLIHAQEFKPNKERDFLFLKTSNEELKNDIETNKLLLNRAFKLILDKVENDLTLDFLSVVDVNFIENEDLFLKEKKKEFINSIKLLERIDIDERKVTLTSISYLHEDILSLEENVVKDIFNVLSQFYNLPKYDVYIYLSKLVNNWENDSFVLLNYSQILNKINIETKGNYKKIIDRNGYQTLIKTVSIVDVELLSKNKVIPNIHFEFCYINSLKKWDLIEESLIEIMDSINCDISSSYLNSEFYFLENLIPYSRENFKDDINKLNGEIITLLEKNEDKSLEVTSIKFYSLISSLVSFISLNKTTSTNIKLTKFLSTRYSLKSSTQKIDSPTVDLNYDSSFKLLARLFIKDITLKGNGFIKSSIDDLNKFIDILFSNSELKKNLLDKLACFPNQQYTLKPQNNLKIDKVLDEDFKVKHKEITGLQIKDNLLIPSFEKFISHTDTINGIQLGDEIERKLSINKEFLPLLKDASKIPILLNLIKYISKTNSQWSYWLPNLSKVKEEVLMTKFKDENTRLSLFNILSESKEKINLLGELAQIKDLDNLIKAGKLKQKEEGRKNNHLQYIKEVGVKIQNLVQGKLDEDLAETIEIVESITDEKLEALEEQNGQDFIIYKSGSPIYYIEVKSRWDSEGIVALSKKQVECCAKNKEKYAVITVNVADYKSRNKVVEDDVSFDDLSNDIYVNVDLSKNFEELIKENQQFEKIKDNTKLIEFRGHIPQDRIRNYSLDFNEFIEELKKIILKDA